MIMSATYQTGFAAFKEIYLSGMYSKKDEYSNKSIFYLFSWNKSSPLQLLETYLVSRDKKMVSDLCHLVSVINQMLSMITSATK